MPAHERPRERMSHVGARALSDAELVSLVLGGDLERAARVVASFGGAAGIGRAEIGELCHVTGVGPARASQLVAAIELGRRTVGMPWSAGRVLATSEDVHEQLRDMAFFEDEELHALLLDGRHRVLARQVAARGTLNRVHAIPRDILRRGVRESAAAMIVAHNHPSGECEPSPEDFALTRRLFDAGELVGIPLLDHLVIARRGFHTFADLIRRWRRSEVMPAASGSQ